ncbi:MAG: hypothetical protein DM484_01955 [Candidatus Methylumidiphilus alinenensis]|uniref:Uncharacterized protein n=1 Tax=Candidatus Methylumidiphilus alinenensis TaxID=2202197 RepID=A0A2W4RM45_9GAMM|nr:MAG: hypothetical protein DM484_01955 [Candidatus Methylumidiphilus alinenensis]
MSHFINLVFGTCLVLLVKIALCADAPYIPLDPNSGVLFSDAVGVNPSTLHLEHVVIDKKEYDIDFSYTGGSNTANVISKTLNPCFASAPEEQYPEVRFRGVHYQKPPQDYTGIIAWLAAVNHGSSLGSVQVKALRLFGVDEDGNIQLVTNNFICQTCDANNKVWGYDMPRSEWRNPQAWYRANNGAVFKVNNNIIEIPTSSEPQMLFHAWNTDWPRSRANQNWYYFAEAEVLPTGSGMIQIGFDYWKSETLGPNTEGAVSSWVCSDSEYPKRWITVRTPLPGLYVPTTTRIRKSWKRIIPQITGTGQ